MRLLAALVLLAAPAGCLQQDHRFDGKGGPPADAGATADAIPGPDGSAVAPTVLIEDTVTAIGDDQEHLDLAGFNNARPYHEIFLSAYEIETEIVSEERWAVCSAAGVCQSTLGVASVPNSFDNAVTFCGFLGMRLPTEAEWEHAVRAGLITPVPFRFEWTLDLFDDSAHQLTGYANPLMDGVAGARTVRGGDSGLVFAREPDSGLRHRWRCVRPVTPMGQVPAEPQPEPCVGGGCQAVSGSAGAGHTCVVRGNGRALCWGAGTGGQIGDQKLFSRPEPAFEVDGLTLVDEIGVGLRHTCARSGSEVYCWGQSEVGQLGDNGLSGRAVAMLVPGLNQPIGLAVAPLHNLVLEADGTVRHWGADETGTFVPGPGGVLLPFDVGSFPGATHISSGRRHACVAGGGDIRCWGEVPDGVGGFVYPLADMASSITPPPGTIIDMVSGDQHTCLLVRPATGDDQVWCMGVSAAFDPMGSTVTVREPMLISSSARFVATGATGTVIVDTSNTVVQISTPGIPPPASPVSASVGVLIGEAHICALDGVDVTCWGKNHHGQLGGGLLDDIPSGALVTPVLP